MTPYDMPDYHALIRGIREIDRANEDSTLARLVCADWLGERGEVERAEFIRAWEEYFRLSKTLSQPTKSSTCRKLIGVVNRLMHTRRNGSPHLQEVDASGLPFIDEIRCPLAWWLAHGPDLCRRHPLKEVVVTDAVPNNYLLCVRYADGTNSSRPQWAWLEQTEAEWLPGDRDDIVPIQFVPFLDGRRGENPRWRNYDAGADARAAYNTAALRWAEAEADRPTTSEG